MVQITDNILRDMAHAVVQATNPQQVLVFGSHARGDAVTGSDVDLLVVEDEPFGPRRSRREELRRIRRALLGFRVPKDVLVYSSEEVARWRESPNHVVARAYREGEVLYVRP